MSDQTQIVDSLLESLKVLNQLYNSVIIRNNELANELQAAHNSLANRTEECRQLSLQNDSLIKDLQELENKVNKTNATRNSKGQFVKK